MLPTRLQISSERYLHPNSAATSREKLSSTVNSRDKLISTSSFTNILLQFFGTYPSSTKSATIKQASTSNLSLASWHGHPRIKSKRPSRNVDDSILALSVTITLAILIIIGVPLGAVLPPKYVAQLPINILMPFYVYPDPKSWDRLVEAAIKHPDTNFTVILSIDHGSGNTAWHSGVYFIPIKRLSKIPNVQAIGYIDTAYGKRDNATVRKQIATYAGLNNSGIPISGIYFDHTPAEDINSARAYMSNISATVRYSHGFSEPAIVVQNPGKVPNANMTSYHADVTVLYEGEFKNMPEVKNIRTQLHDLHGRREDYAEIVHSVPRTISRGGVRKIINQSRREIGWMFVTDRLGDNKYEWYSDRWEEFLDLIW